MSDSNVRVINYKDLKLENPYLKAKISKDTEVKKLLVECTGNILKPENDEITVEMIIEMLSKEFPEFVLAIAEENWIRGYHQCLEDLNQAEKLLASNSHE